jgi:MFS family permease
MRSLSWLIFTAGLVTLGMELSASRLLEPAFGNSQIVWAAIIGLILLSLAVGAWLGGWLADRYPHRYALELTLTAGAVGVALVPLLSTPVLRLASQGMADFAPGLLFGALVAVGLLFAIPAILLGTATPWAVRLAMAEGRTASGDEPGANPALFALGQTTGRLSATATAGSLVGAFLPVLWLIPTFGTRWTFYLLALLLLTVISLSALRRPHRWIPLTALLGVLAMALLLQPHGVRAAWDDERTGALLYEDESAFNYIAVRQWGSERHLKLNDGIGIHSVYHPDMLLSQGIWDYFLLAPLFREGGIEGLGDWNRARARDGSIDSASSATRPSLLFIGAAAGTAPGLYTQIYGAIPIIGVELDPQIIAVGEEYFAATWPNYTAVAADGRRWLAQQPPDVRFDVIAVDAYRPPYIPFHLTTVEYFELVRSHLTADGVVAVNVGRSDANYALVDAMTATLQQVFPSVFVIDEPGPPHTLANSLVVATMQPTTLAQFHASLAALPATLPTEFIDFANSASRYARVATPLPAAPIFTDDHSQVEQVVHSLIVDFIFGQ